jgi:hypothetical protein
VVHLVQQFDVQVFDERMFDEAAALGGATWTGGRTMQNARSTDDAPGFLGLGGLRLTRRGRVVLTALVLLVLVGAGLIGQRAVAEAPGGGIEVQIHTVAPGETLWQYAHAVRDSGEDLRDVVAELRDLNGLATAELEAGQVVLLPLE